MGNIKAIKRSKRQCYHDALMDMIVDYSRECHVKRCDAFATFQAWAYRGNRRWIGGRDLHTGIRPNSLLDGESST